MLNEEYMQTNKCFIIYLNTINVINEIVNYIFFKTLKLVEEAY